MTYVIDIDAGKTQEEFDRWRKRWQEYHDYLQTLRGKIPQSAFEFATAEWHYTNDHPRNLHDAWVNALIIREPSKGERHQIRSLEIEVELLGPYHDGKTTLIYRDVQAYSLDTPLKDTARKNLTSIAHGDWLVDEVRLSDRGFVVHEVKFDRGSRWLIECQDIECSWSPFKAT